MAKHIFMLLSAAALFVCGTAVGWAEGLSSEVKAQLCQEKKAGLAKLEAEAPQIRALLPQKESELESSRAAMDLMDKAVLALESGVIPGWIQAVAGTGLDAAKAWATQQHGQLVAKVGPLRDEISRLKQRQTEVGSQIFLLRDIIAGLGCDTPTPAPPVDYGAIDQHTQQFQQSGPGATSGTSGQSVQPQGSYATPSSGFGAPSGSTQPAGQQGQQPGYGPGPQESGSPSVNWQGLVPPSSPGGSEGHSHPSGGG